MNIRFLPFQKTCKTTFDKIKADLNSGRIDRIFISVYTTRHRGFRTILCEYSIFTISKTNKATFDEIKANFNPGKIDWVIYITRYRGSRTIFCDYTIFTIAKTCKATFDKIKANFNSGRIDRVFIFIVPLRQMFYGIEKFPFHRLTGQKSCVWRIDLVLNPFHPRHVNAGDLGRWNFLGTGREKGRKLPGETRPVLLGIPARFNILTVYLHRVPH